MSFTARRAAWSVVLTLSASATASATITVEGSPQDKAAWQAKIDHCKTHSPAFATILQEIEGHPTEIKIKLVNGSKRVWVDNFGTKEVDLADISDFPELDPPQTLDQCEIMLHILVERFHDALLGQGYEKAHIAAILVENYYRAAHGYTDQVVNHEPSPDGKMMCTEWKIPGQPNKKTYMAKADERTEGLATQTSEVVLPGGKTQRTFQIVPSQTVDTLELPLFFGGGTSTIRNHSGSIVIETESSEFPGYLRAKVVQLSTQAPSVPLPFPFGSTGTNFLSVDPSGMAFGYVNTTNGQVGIAYTGRIVNQLFPPSLPVRFYSFLTANWTPGTSTLAFRTAAALLDNGLTAQYGIETYGFSNGGCVGEHAIGANSPPTVGNSGFALTSTNGEPGGTALALVTDVADDAGTDLLGLGTPLWVDLVHSTTLIGVDMSIDGAGVAYGAAPIPGASFLIGVKLYANTLHLNTICSVGPLNLSSSNGAAITIQM